MQKSQKHLDRGFLRLLCKVYHEPKLFFCSKRVIEIPLICLVPSPLYLWSLGMLGRCVLQLALANIDTPHLCIEGLTSAVELPNEQHNVFYSLYWGSHPGVCSYSWSIGACETRCSIFCVCRMWWAIFLFFYVYGFIMFFNLTLFIWMHIFIHW